MRRTFAHTASNSRSFFRIKDGGGTIARFFSQLSLLCLVCDINTLVRCLRRSRFPNSSCLPIFVSSYVSPSFLTDRTIGYLRPRSTPALLHLVIAGSTLRSISSSGGMKGIKSVTLCLLTFSTGGAQRLLSQSRSVASFTLDSLSSSGAFLDFRNESSRVYCCNLIVFLSC